MGSLTKEQQMFLVTKRRLAEIDAEREKAKDKNEELSSVLAREEEILKNGLFNKVIRFGMSLAKKRMSKYILSNDAYEDVKQALSVVFYENLPRYNPQISTPTTFYRRYFDQAITEYVLNYSQKLTQYDAHNVSVCRAAVHHYEARGIKWDEDMIASKTGLSRKVVKTSLALANNAIYADIEEMINLSAKEPTPEEEYIKTEREDTISAAIKNTLSPHEYEVFMYRMNLDEQHERNYQQVADYFGVTQHEIKRIYNGIIAKLQSNSDLLCYSNKSGQEAPKVALQKKIPMDDNDLLFESFADSSVRFAPTDFA